MADRPQNVRAASILERGYVNSSGHHGRRLVPEERVEENQIMNRPYRGSHRAGPHHADEQTPAQQRSSRVGRHHAEPAGHSTGDLTGRL